MTERSSDFLAAESLRILLVDPDPVFCLGLRTCLEQAGAGEVVAEAADGNGALMAIARALGAPQGNTMGQIKPCLDLIMLDPLVPSTAPRAGQFLFQQLKAKFPALPILLLGDAAGEFLPLAIAAGVEGYAAPNTPIDQLIVIIRQLASGGRFWTIETEVGNRPRPTVGQVQAGRSSQWHHHLLLPGLAQMDSSLAELQSYLERSPLSSIDRLVLEGRCREIRCARWLVQTLLPPGSVQPAQSLSSQQSRSMQTIANPVAIATTSSSAIAPIEFATLKSLLFDATLAKCQTGLPNLSGEAQEIDILRPDKKRELLIVVLRKFEDLLDKLRQSQVTLMQLNDKRSQILIDLWQAATTDFFGKYYTLPLTRPGQPPHPPEAELVASLLQGQSLVEAAILNQTPLVIELVEHLLFQLPLPVDNTARPAGSSEALQQAEWLLQNLLVRVANAVIQPLLNRFADVEAIKQNFYDRRVISTREIERFRNALSWKYQYYYLITEPSEMFESQFGLIVLGDRGLEKVGIYIPRDQELRQLGGLRLVVTLALEARDAISPPLRSTVAWLGRGLIYLLTQVIGRGIGLIGRGILQGIGHSWQDIQLSRRSQQPK
jgi:DNA-binding NarL/FixJ family response regulator